MSLSKAQLNKLSKEELINFTLKIQEAHGKYIEEIVKKLDEALENIKALTDRQQIIESSLVVSKNVNDKLQARVIKLEREVYVSQQYSRRECLEFTGIPSDVDNKDLEGKVCEILQAIDVNVNPDDLEACHRLKKKERTIVKFSNRKTCLNALKNRKRLKDLNREEIGFPDETSLYLNESLCPYYRGLWGKCRGLLVDKLIARLWTYNGTVMIKFIDNDDAERFSITHDTDLFSFFPDRDFTKRN